MSTVLQRIRRSIRPEGLADGSDGQLMESFLARRDEIAFAALVRRHGPMVWGVCRRVLGHHHDAEDAFQAAFLVLARKAATVTPRSMLANWLYGVAYHTALKARALAGKRRAREKQVADMPEPEAREGKDWTTLEPLLDRELHGLPARYRAAIILCDLEGKARREAARSLGVPEGTLSARLTRGRRLLADRLSKRGLALSAGALAALLAGDAGGAGVPASAAAAVIKAAVGAAGPVADVSALTEGVLKAMLLQRLKHVTIVLAFIAVVGCGVGVLMSAALGGPTGWYDTVENGPPTHGQQPLPAQPGAAKVAEPIKDNAAVWTLDFRAKSLRLIAVAVPGQGKQTVWYLCYEVSNPGGEPHTFIPDFEVEIGKVAHHDKVLPMAQDVIAGVEDPTGNLGFKNSVTIAAEPIPLVKAPDSVHGLALWDDVDPEAKSAIVYVSGLTNACSVDGNEVRRKVLKLVFERQGTEMQLKGAPEWVYRSAKLPPAPIQGARELEGRWFGDAVVEFKGDTFWMRRGKAEFWGTFQLAAGKNPKEIDVAINTTANVAFLLRQSPWRGIYALDGDTLKVCFGAKRPIDFKDDEANQQELLTLKRVVDKPGDPAPPKPDPKPPVQPGGNMGEVIAKAEYGDWSKASDGLQGRLVQQKVSSPGRADVLKITVELHNMTGGPKMVEFKGASWDWKLLDLQGKPVPESRLPRSGPVFVHDQVIVPPHTYVGVSVYSSGVGVPPKGTLIPLQPGSHDWVLQPGEYTLRATLVPPPHKDTPKDAWIGQLEFPPLKIVVK